MRIVTPGTPAPPESLVLGRYRVGEVLGRGGMATVYRGEDTRTGREVAIKVLAPHLSADPAFRGRMLAEARAVARLPHPHIVQVFDTGQVSPTTDRIGENVAPGALPPQDQAMAIIMELVPGEPLDRRIARGPLPLASAVDVATQVAEALAFAHARGVVHRDVKPHNILLTDPPEGTRGGLAAADQARVWAKLADFGIARSLDATTSYTATGLVMGSAPYIAPEVLQGAPGDERADVYSLGATLFEALAGRLPFVGTTAAQALTQRLTQGAPSVRSFRPDVPPWLEDVLAACLERDPARRIGSAAALAQALRQTDATTTVLSESRADVPTEPLTSWQAGAPTLTLSVVAPPVVEAASPGERAVPVLAAPMPKQRDAAGAGGADHEDERPPRSDARRSRTALVALLAALPIAYLAAAGGWSQIRPALPAWTQGIRAPSAAVSPGEAPPGAPTPAATQAATPAATAAAAVPVLATPAPPALPPTATSAPRASSTPPPAATRALPTATARPSATEPPSIRIVLPVPPSAAESKNAERSVREIEAAARERAAALREQLRARQQAIRDSARLPERKSKPSEDDDD